MSAICSPAAWCVVPAITTASPVLIDAIHLPTGHQTHAPRYPALCAPAVLDRAGEIAHGVYALGISALYSLPPQHVADPRAGMAWPQMVRASPNNATAYWPDLRVHRRHIRQRARGREQSDVHHLLLRAPDASEGEDDACAPARVDAPDGHVVDRRFYAGPDARLACPRCVGESPVSNIYRWGDESTDSTAGQPTCTRYTCARSRRTSRTPWLNSLS